MERKVNDIEEMTIDEFADIHNLTMQITERKVPYNSSMRYSAHFESTEVKEGCCLTGVYGNGNTIREAEINYAEKIELMMIVINAMTGKRREIDVPRLITRDKRKLYGEGKD